jgi:hypothetical protein
MYVVIARSDVRSGVSTISQNAVGQYKWRVICACRRVVNSQGRVFIIHYYIETKSYGARRRPGFYWAELKSRPSMICTDWTEYLTYF